MATSSAKAVTFLSEIRKEEFNAPRALWEKVFDDGARERFVKNVSGHMENCKDKEIIKRQIAIFREVSEDLAAKLEKATDVKGYPGIADLSFNGSHNGMAKDRSKRLANGGKSDIGESIADNNGAPRAGTHKSVAAH